MKESDYDDVVEWFCICGYSYQLSKKESKVTTAMYCIICGNSMMMEK